MIRERPRQVVYPQRIMVVKFIFSCKRRFVAWKRRYLIRLSFPEIHDWRHRRCRPRQRANACLNVSNRQSSKERDSHRRHIQPRLSLHPSLRTLILFPFPFAHFNFVQLNLMIIRRLRRDRRAPFKLDTLQVRSDIIERHAILVKYVQVCRGEVYAGVERG